MHMPRQVEIDPERLWAALMEMAEIGATPAGGVHRLALSDEDRRARDLLVRWLGEAGCRVRVDDLGNIYGRRACSDARAAPVVFGSHLDTVPTGGRFDGALGVIAALEVVRAIDSAGVTTRRPLEVVCWTNEEGVRFAPAMLASGVVCGRFTLEEAYATRDADGLAFGDELRRIGYRGDATNRIRDAAAYLELHVEQGPVLERARAQVGVVEGIEGISWNRVEVTGQAAHAGPTPIEDRRDALVAAARIVLGLRALAERTSGLRATVGHLEVGPNAINVIPGGVRLTADMRAPRTDTLEGAAAGLREICADVVRSDRVEVRAEEFWRSPPTPFAAPVVDAVAGAAEELGYTARRLWAGAGHDAKYMADRFPAAMIFVPSAGGLSHNEREWTAPEDCVRGARVLLEVVLRLASDR
jgi:N-carbamoyl-L-amino-acid hydrolase